MPKIKNSRHFKKSVDFDISKVSVYFCPVNKDYCFAELHRLAIVKPFGPGKTYYKSWEEVVKVMEHNQVCVGIKGYLISVEEKLKLVEKNRNRKKAIKTEVKEEVKEETEEVKEETEETPKPKHRLMNWNW